MMDTRPELIDGYNAGANWMTEHIDLKTILEE
jgi:hypothetical protein